MAVEDTTGFPSFREQILRALALFALLVTSGLVLASTARAEIEAPPPPQVWSDQADYAPGEMVTLSGANWAPGESVHLRVNDDAGQTWSRDVDVTADENGGFSDQFNLPEWFVAVYNVTATGATSGTATWSFTDGNLTSVSGTVTDSVTGNPIAGAIVSCTTTSGCNANFSALTDALGIYDFSGSNKLTFAGNGPTTLTLNVSRTGYNSGTITLAGVNNGDTRANQDVALVPSDTTPPAVGSINRSSSSPTNASSVQWSVAFSENVTGVNAGDFALAAGGGVTGAGVTSVSGSGANYTVTASTGSGDGTLGLNLDDDDSIADAAGNKLGGTGAGNGNFTGQVYTVDKTAPTVSAAAVKLPGSAPYAAGSWTNQSVRVTFTCSDSGGSGLTAGSGNQTQDFTTNTSFAGATATFSGTCADNAGNAAAGGTFGPVRIDKTSPTITASLTPAPNANGWNNTDVLVEFDCADGLSGLNPAGGNDGAGCWNDETVTAEGLTTFVNRTAFDNAGNFSSIDVDVRIDKTNPTSAATSPAYSGSNSFSVSYSALDGRSGLDEVELWAKAPGAAGYSKVATDSSPGASGSFAYTAADGEGSYAFYTRALDNAGNYEDAPADADTTTFVDMVAPDTVIDSNPADPSMSSSASFSFHGDDPAPSSGIAGFRCSLDGAAYAACDSGSASYTSLADGMHTFDVTARDNAGNEDPSPAHFAWLVDTVAPSSADDAPAGWQNADTTVHLSATDPGAGDTPPTGSGVASIKYSVDGGALQSVPGASANVTVPAPADHSNDGVHTITYYATDNAGNVEAANSATVRIDTRNPASQAVSPAYNNVSAIFVSFTASDPAPASGLAKVEFWAKGPADAAFTKYDETTTSLASGSFSYSVTQGDGLYRFYTIAVDNAGNREVAPATPDTSIQVATTLQDTVAPASSAASPDYDNGGDITVVYSASDGGSGLDSVELWAKAPGASSFSLAMTDSSPGPSGSFNYSPSAGDGAYDFYTRARDKATNYEDAPAAADDSTLVDTVAPTVNCGSADGLWHADNVSIGCTATDGGSGLADAGDAIFSLSTSVAAGHETNNASTNSQVVKDNAGNEATAGPIGGNKIDRKGPSVTLTCPASPVVKGSSATASWSASDGGSGLVGASNGTISLDTSSVGSQTASVPAGFKKDNVDNESSAATCNYSVIYDWRGFFQPVDNLPALNKVKAGSAIPVKFSLGGNQGLSIFMAGYPSSSQIACGSTANADLIEQTVTAGQSTLQYDAAVDQYIYVWKTQSAWSNTCRTLTVKLVDGTFHQANFWFVK